MFKNILKINSCHCEPLIKTLKAISNLKYFGTYRGNPHLSKDFERERHEYKKLKKEAIKKHTQEFWEEQTKVENEWLEDFIKIQKEKKIKDNAKLRSTIIKNSFQCYENIKQEINNQQAFLAKQKTWREEDTQLLMEKHSILSMLDKQAEEDWLTPDNIDTKLSQQINRILPPTILSHVDYYRKLNDYALLMEQGFTKEAEELKLNKKMIDYKNKKMQPIYEELKMIIRHLTYSEEHSVFCLYKETMMRIDNYFLSKENQHDFDFLKDNLTYLFKRLITLIRAENERADNKLELIENQLKSLTMILVLWDKYVELIYLPDAEVEKLIENEKNISEQYNRRNNDIRNKSLEDLVEEKDPSNLKNYYLTKITEKKTKGSGLFINDFRGLYDDPAIRRTVEGKSGKKLEEDDQEAEGRKLNNSKQLNEEFTTESEEEEGEVASQKETKAEIHTEKILLKSEAKGKESDKEEVISKEEKKALPPGTEKQKTLKSKKARKAVQGEKRKLLENEATEIFEEKDEWGAEEESAPGVHSEKIKAAAEKVDKIETKESSKIKATMPKSKSTSKSAQPSSEEFIDPLELKSIDIDRKEAAIKKIKHERSLLEEYMLMALKREAQKSKYSKVDVQTEFKNYKANLVKELGLKDETELFADIDKELEEVDLSKIIDINEFEVELKKEQERITLEKEFKGVKNENLFNSSLFDSIIKYSKNIFDFKKPQISTNLDIYDTNLIKYLEYSIQESDVTFRSTSTSLIMEFIKEELNQIDDNELSPANRLKKKHLIKVADVCGRMRVKDSQNLKQVFDMFKHPSVKF